VPPSGATRAHREASTLADLYEDYYDRVVRYLAARIGNRDRAQDMASDVFLRAAETLGEIQDRAVPPQAWLFRVAHNLLVDYYRRESRRQSVPLEDISSLAGASDLAYEVEHRMTMQSVQQAMQRLNPAQQEVITLRFMAELSSQEVGAVMGRTNGAVRELQRTALKALRRLMAEPEKEAGRHAQREHDA
jgi:RNA polymerase sigma-70 factor (ECF subfamily)